MRNSDFTRSRVARFARTLARGVIAVALLLLLLSLTTVLALRWFNPPTTAFMLNDSSNQKPLLHEWVDWSGISQYAALAVVAAEDQNFALHFGFDVESIQRSLEVRQAGGALRGASTISQQVAKNLFLWPGRSFVRKGIEAYFTVLIELLWPKQRILEVYVNIAEFGPGIYGVGAASKVYFGISPSQLTMANAALLAAVLPNPKRFLVATPSDYVRKRQAWIMGQMQRLEREKWIRTLE